MKFLFFIIIALFAFSFNSFAQEQNERDKAIELYRQDEYQKASEILQASVKTNEEDSLAWVYLGASYLKLKNEKEASKAFRKAGSFSIKDLTGYDQKLEIISKPHARFTDEARSNRISGTVKIAIEFKADGTIGFAFPIQKLSYGLTENAVEAAQAIKFNPPVKDGKPVTVVAFLEYTFLVY